MPGFGVYLIVILLAVVGLVCIIPIVVVAFFRKTRRSVWAWIAACTPLLALSTFVTFTLVVVGLENRVCEAARSGDAQEVTRLMSIGVSPDASDMDGYPAIHEAITHEHWDIVRTLIESGATNTHRGPEHATQDESVLERLKQSGHQDLAELMEKRLQGD